MVTKLYFLEDNPGRIRGCLEPITGYISLERLDKLNIQGDTLILEIAFFFFAYRWESRDQGWGLKFGLHAEPFDV